MPRFIEATEAIRVLSEYYHHRTDTQRYVLAEAISRVPTADVVERKKGKWEFIGGYGYQYRCSACIMCAEHKTNFCPNCGADMR